MGLAARGGERMAKMLLRVEVDDDVLLAEIKKAQAMARELQLVIDKIITNELILKAEKNPTDGNQQDFKG